MTANIAEQVIKEVNECLTGRGKDALAPDKEQLLRRQITSAVAVTDNAVFKLMSRSIQISNFLFNFNSQHQPERS